MAESSAWATWKYTVIDTGRYELILDLVQQRKHPLVLFLWKHQRDLLVAEAEKRGLSFCVFDGETSDEDRLAYVQNYQRGAYDVMFPYMQARNIPGSYMPTTDYLAAPNGNQITVAELNEMQADGWTIVPHQTIGTALTSMTEAQIRAEIEKVLSVHASYGWTFKGFYYPSGGAGNDLSDQVMASYGIANANNNNTANLNEGRPLYGGNINPYRQWSYTADSKTFASDIKPAIDHAVTYGGALGILWHDGSGANEAEFKASIDYLYRLREANVVDVVNYETFFRRFSNPRNAR